MCYTQEGDSICQIYTLKIVFSCLGFDVIYEGKL